VTAVFAAGTLGPRELNAAVLDRRSGRTGSAGAFLEVPSMNGLECVLSGLAVETGTGVRESPAVRQFTAGQTVKFRYFVYNPALDAEGKGNVETQVRLFAGGREAYSGSVTAIRLEKGTDAAHWQIKGQIAMDLELASGRYILQVTVMDTVAKQPKAISQFIDFEVVPRK